MPSPDSAKRAHLAADLVALGEERTCKIIGGEIVEKAAPGPDHAEPRFRRWLSTKSDFLPRQRER